MKNLNDLLDDALSFYSFRNPIIELIRHNENMTYKVTTFEKQYVMRIHQPVEGFSLGVFNINTHSVTHLKGELDIIESIKQNTDIVTQTPVKNKLNEFITILHDGTPVTVLEWIDGNILSNIDLTVKEMIAIGVMTAKMHKYFMNNDTHLKFKRYTYDQSTINIIIKRINTAKENNYVSLEHAKIILEALVEIKHRMGLLDKIPNSKGIVHADLSKSNMILNNNRITPIDFSLSGYSHYYMDLGGLFGEFTNINDRKAIISGYESVMNQKVNPWYIEPYFALSVILFIAAQYERSEKWDWFESAMERWCNTIFIPLRNKVDFIEI